MLALHAVGINADPTGLDGMLPCWRCTRSASMPTLYSATFANSVKA